MRIEPREPRISFGIIVLNGEPYTRYCLRALYPFAHQIIVVEGGAPAARGIATPNGHSTDGTLETLRAFKAQEDPDDKVILVTAEDEGHQDGFWWGEKDEQSRAYARRATGNYLWQVDIDEFYRPEDLDTIIGLLRSDPSVTGLAFQGIHFWGGFDYWVESGIMWHPGRNEYRRIFKFGPGYRYTTHRPPTVRDPDGADVMSINALGKEDTAARGLFMYHYYAVFPSQVRRKARYYRQLGWEHMHNIETWVRDTWMRLKRPLHLFHAYNHYSWLQRFTGQHPPAIRALREDICQGVVNIEQRPVHDIERLLDSPWYRLSRTYAQKVERRKLQRTDRPGLLAGAGRVLHGGRLLGRALVTKLRDDWLAQHFPAKPIVLQFPVNDICNGRCLMCNIWQRKHDRELSPKELRYILHDPLFEQVRYVGLNGGEPTLRPDLPEIGRVLIKALPKLRGVNIITNAIQTQRVVERILALAEVVQTADLDFEVSVSLDGVGADHDKNRGVQGNFTSAVQVIQRLRQAGLPVSIGCTLTPINCYAADDVLSWCLENGIGKWVFRLGVEIKRVYNDGYANQHPFSPEQRFHLIMFFDKLAHHSNVEEVYRRFYRGLVGQLAFGQPREAGCDWRNRGVTLDAHGEISYCSVQSPILGSALTGSGWRIFRKGLPQRRRILREHCQSCRHNLLGPPPARVLARAGLKAIAEPWRRKQRPGSFRAPRLIRSAERPRPRDWRHVLITGWYGTETAGDKAILGELVHFIKTNTPACRISLTTLDRKVSEQTRHELSELDQINIVDAERGHDPALIESVDAVIMGGGPLQEIGQTEYVWRMFAEANRQSKARVIFGCGIGPLYSDRLREMVSALLRMTTAGFMRDQESHERALRLGADESLGCACDPALAYIQRWSAKTQSIPAEQEPLKIAGLLRANTREYVRGMGHYELKNVNSQIAGRIARVLEPVCMSHQAIATLLPMHALWVGGDDRLFNRQVAACFDNPQAVLVERGYLPLGGLLQTLTAAQAAIAMRYHGHLFCLALGIPFLSIDYTGRPGKVHSLLRRIGYQQWSEEWGSLDVDRAASHLECLLTEHEHWSTYLRRKSAEMINQLHNTYTQVFGAAAEPEVALPDQMASQIRPEPTLIANG